MLCYLLVVIDHRLRLTLRQGFIQHKITHESFTLQNNTNILNKYEPDMNKNTCCETSTKIIADRFRRGHPECGGVLRSVVGI